MMNSVNELVDDVLWRELAQHLERRKSTVSYRRPIVDLKLHYLVTENKKYPKIVKRSGIRNAHSLVANFLSMIGYWWGNGSNIFMSFGDSLIGKNSTFGIVVGTGSQTKSASLTDLQNPITPSSTGLSADNEYYSGPVAINNDASAVLRETRLFVNYDTTSISISEIGIYGNTSNANGPMSGFNPWTTSSKFSDNRVLLAYDLLSPPVVLQPSQAVTFEYDWIVNV